MTDLPAVLDVLVYALLLTGSLLCFTAGLGLLRFHDVLSRMHAGTKPQVMGVLLVVAGAAIRLWGSPVAWMLVLVLSFQLLTAPLSAHLVSRMAYRRRHVREDLLLVDELGFSGFGRPPESEHAPRGDEPAEAMADRARDAGAIEGAPGQDS
jgi:multicomponent Na+:H+ antiporter subunit G